jgi:hypothetical protein
MKRIYISILTLAALAFAMMMGSCSKTNSTTNVTVGFHFHSYIDTSVLDPAGYVYQAYRDGNGRLEHLNIAQMYVSNIAVHMYKGAWQPLTGVVIMKRIDNEEYQLGQIPSGAMDSVKFTVGLGNALNSQPPSSYSASSPLDSVLATETGPMWGSNMAGMATMASTSGYTFVNVQGYDSTDHLPFSYQIGGYGDTTNIVMAVPGGFNFNPILTNGGINYIHIYADYGKLLQAITPMNSGNTNSAFYGPNPAPANTLLNSIKSIFGFECLPPINC